VLRTSKAGSQMKLDFCSVKFAHVIGISPYMSAETSQVEYHIIDGSHTEMKAINFNLGDKMTM
jgi:hypothetical protein